MVKFINKLIISTGLSFVLASSSFAVENYNKAKKYLYDYYKDTSSSVDFYCGLPFHYDKRDRRMEFGPSGSNELYNQTSYYEPRNPYTKKGKPNARASRIEWEHIMPAENFGRHLQCWREGGRKQCSKDSKTFREMEGDLHNLVPAIGEINGDRSNYRYAEAPRDLVYSQYGNCKVHTDFKAKRFYPSDRSKGWIARSYLYMSDTYGVRLSSQERKLMEAWDRQFPMTNAEKHYREYANSIREQEQKFNLNR